MGAPTPEIYTWDYTLSLHDALPISRPAGGRSWTRSATRCSSPPRSEEHTSELQSQSHISYAVFCLKKKKITAVLCPAGSLLDETVSDRAAALERLVASVRVVEVPDTRPVSRFFFFNDPATPEIYT